MSLRYFLNAVMCKASYYPEERNESRDSATKGFYPESRRNAAEVETTEGGEVVDLFSCFRFELFSGKLLETSRSTNIIGDSDSFVEFDG
ncbi:hypothetical protein JTB14_006340 [Gonioctena quinquepunctata]|nr:hypothetical protein JTB14_006340 [Gonioctena quinquepunctata]